MKSPAVQMLDRVTRLDFLEGLGIAIGRRHLALAHVVKRLATVTLVHHRVVEIPPPPVPEPALVPAVPDAAEATAELEREAREALEAPAGAAPAIPSAVPAAPTASTAEADARRLAIGRAIGAFVSEHQIETDRTHLVLPRSQALLSRLSLPEAARKDLAQVVEFEIDRLIPLSRDEIFFDSLLVNPNAGGKLDLLVVSMPRRVVAEALAALTMAGLRARSVVITPVAALDFVAFASPGGFDGTSLLFDDDGTVELDILARGTLAASHLVRPDEVASMPALTRFLQATALVHGFGDAAPRIYAWSGASAAAAGGPTPLGAEMAKGAAYPADLAPSGRDLIGLASHRLVAPAGFFESASPALVPALGAALAAVREGTAGVNLLPEEERRGTDEGAPVVTFFLAAVVALMTVVWLVSAMIQDRRIDARLHEQIAELEPQLRAISGNEQEAKELHDKLKILTQDDARRVSLVLRELTDAIPGEAYLTTFRMRNGKLELEGFAKAASDLVPVLEKSPRFRNVQFTSPVTKVQNNQERFSLTAELEE